MWTTFQTDSENIERRNRNFLREYPRWSSIVQQVPHHGITHLIVPDTGMGDRVHEEY